MILDQLSGWAKAPVRTTERGETSFEYDEALRRQESIWDARIPHDLQPSRPLGGPGLHKGRRKTWLASNRHLPVSTHQPWGLFRLAH
jgi:hypothetical protein